VSVVLRPRVLVAEDEPQQDGALARALEAAGFERLVAHDGVEALDLARSQAVEAVVLDRLLRRLDGMRVCELLKRDPLTTNLPVLILSGVYVDGEEERRALAAGADRYLPRPDGAAGHQPEAAALVRELHALLGTKLGSDPPAATPATVLVIEDDPENRAFLRRALQRRGVRLVEAATAAEALDRLASESPALALLDIRMPGTSGLDLLPRLRSASPETVVVMMTAFGSEQVAAEAVRRGADDYIAKPIELARLRELIERNLEKYRLRLERQALLRRLKESNHYLTRQHEQLRLAQEQILAQNRQLEEASRFKSEFLANMSHELRTPLNAIIGFSQIMLDPTMNQLQSAEREEFLTNIHGSAQHLLALINEILDLAKVEAGKMELRPARLDVEAMLAEVAAVIDPLARRGELQLTVEAEAGLPPVAADQSKLKQVLYNLLANAVKFTPAGGQIALTAARMDDAVRFAVRDTGIGIRPQDYPKLFHEFQQLDPSYTRRYEGTGLGLALCKRFVEMHGGRIWAESRPGHGSVFYFTLPLQIPLGGEAAPALRLLETPVGEVDGRPLVLIIDDDRRTAAATGQLLIQAGYRVIYARDGDEGVRRALNEDPQLIVLEVVLPRKDGWAVLQELHSFPITRETPVLVASVMDNRPLAVALGASDYTRKPVDPEDFLRRVHRLVHRVQALRQRVKVLLVHPDRDLVHQTASLLVEQHFNVFRAEALQEAALKLDAARPDVVVVAAGLAGPAFWEHVQGLPTPRPHVVALTTAGSPDAQSADTVVDPADVAPSALVRCIQQLERVQRIRRSGHDRRHGADRRRQPRESAAGAVRPGA
jgi:signal transduction histidine kinase